MSTAGRKLTDLELDMRVRERLLASGAIKPEEIEAYTAALPDLEAQAETMPFDQPALGAGSGGHRAEISTSIDEGLE